MATIVVLADTHVRATGRPQLPAAVLAAAGRADVVLHAGDLVHPCVLDALGELAPVHAVLGNNDAALSGRLPETIELDVGGVRIAMVHDSGSRAGRERRLHRRFPAADLVVFGHSHVPFDGRGVGGQRLFNPGSPTQRRRMPTCTYGLIETGDGEIARHEIVAI